jgi:hypothetical protein
MATPQTNVIIISHCLTSFNVNNLLNEIQKKIGDKKIKGFKINIFILHTMLKKILTDTRTNEYQQSAAGYWQIKPARPRSGY